MTTITIAENDEFEVTGTVVEWAKSNKTNVNTYIDMEALGHTHPEYTLRGEDPESDKAWDAFNRLEVKLMKEQILKANEALHFLPKDGWKMNFSKTAGCTCGCSPAFKLTTSTGTRLGYGTNEARFWGFKYVTVTKK